MDNSKLIFPFARLCSLYICFSANLHSTVLFYMCRQMPTPLKHKNIKHRYRSGSHFGSHRILGHITSRLPHQLTTKPRFYCVPTVFLYVFVEFVELTWHIRHDPKCENRWNFFNPIFCHELHEILKNGFGHCNRGFLKLQMLFHDFCS